MLDGSAKPMDEREEGADTDRLKRLQAIAGRLQSRADERTKRRTTVENRWLADLRQYHGVYTETEKRRIADLSGSEIFENQTRPKVNAMSARLSDLLFPTDDRNWEIEPTPVPELAEGSEEIERLLEQAAETKADADSKLKEAAQEGADEGQMTALAQGASDAEEALSAVEKAAEELEETLKEARQRSRLMSEEIDDQLTEARYGAQARDALMDACKIGTGILKGPIIGDKTRRRWAKDEVDGTYAMSQEVVQKAGVVRCDPWHTFLDPDCLDPNDGEGVFERHFYNKRQMRRLAIDPKMDKDAIRRCLEKGPAAGDTPHFMPILNDITGEGKSKLNDHFLVWEYSGPIDWEDMEALAESFGDEETLKDLDDIADPLLEINARVWFCQGDVLKFVIYPLDSGDSLYSVFNIQEDEVGPYGYGVAYLMKSNQEMLNGAARMLMDNAGLGAGPQVVINDDAISPEDGQFVLRPRKIWRYKNASAVKTTLPPFSTFDVPIHQQELTAIMEMALKFMDDDTSMPRIAQGEQGVGVTKTAQGMALLMNAANVVFKRVVKDWDDRITVPLITRFYDFNMQFSKKEGIKGDYNVKARGSSVLLVREMLSQNLLLIAQIFGDHPVYKELIDSDALLKEIFRAHQIPAGTIVKTRSQIKRDREEAQSNPTPEMQIAMQQLEEAKRANDLKEQELELKAELANLDADTRRYIADKTIEAKKIDIETRANMNLDTLETRATDKADAEAIRAAKEARASEDADRRLAVEVAMREDTGVSSGGAI